MYAKSIPPESRFLGRDHERAIKLVHSWAVKEF